MVFLLPSATPLAQRQSLMGETTPLPLLGETPRSGTALPLRETKNTYARDEHGRSAHNRGRKSIFKTVGHGEFATTVDEMDVYKVYSIDDPWERTTDD